VEEKPQLTEVKVCQPTHPKRPRTRTRQNSSKAHTESHSQEPGCGIEDRTESLIDSLEATTKQPPLVLIHLPAHGRSNLFLTRQRLRDACFELAEGSLEGRLGTGLRAPSGPWRTERFEGLEEFVLKAVFPRELRADVSPGQGQRNGMG